MHYPSPQQMRRSDGSARFAYVTFLLFNLSHKYVESAMLMAYALRKLQTEADIICMVTPGMPAWAEQGLKTVFDQVMEVEPIFLPHPRRHHRPDIPFLFTRFQALRLGPDGDLGQRYEKIVLLDADVLPLRYYDHLFSLPAPAGIINESKDTFRDYDDNGQYIIPDSVAVDGTWKWHRIYNPICPHGSLIPSQITDRPRTDFDNLGIIGAFFVINTSLAEFNAIMQDVQRPEVSALVGEKFSLPDMQYLTYRYSGNWTSVDLRFCALNGYPRLDVLCGTHYAGGTKPWSVKKRKALESYGRFEDFQYWYVLYKELFVRHPELHKLKRLREVHDLALELTAG